MPTHPRSPRGVCRPPNGAPIMNTILRKSVLGIAGLAFTGGVFAGPVAAHAVDPTHAVKPVTATVQSDKLIPHGVQGAQSRIDLNDEQTANVKAIIAATKKAGMDERAAVVSIATALQESKLENLGHLGDRNDHDSQGLFQQRPSSGWGTVEQITDPEYSTTAFLKGLKQVDGWQDMPLTKAAQTVQVSAYPDHYAQWEQQAADLVAEHWNK
ncbi:secreted protein [Micromonospora sp. M42]|nr:secreted protein [Micromonospora sp. M42]